MRFLAAVIALSTATASTAAVLVVRSNGPSARNYPPGKSLADNQKLSLQTNDVLVLLDARGTRTLRGPGSFTPGGPAKTSGVMSPLGAVTGSPRGRARVGAVRSVGLGSTPKPSLWQIDVTKSSNMCVTGAAGLSLWRPDATRPATLTVSGRQPGASRQLKLAAGQSSIAWPAEMPVRDGEEYRLNWDGAPAPTRMQFKTLPERPAGLEETAATLISNGCIAQLDLLIQTAPASTG